MKNKLKHTIIATSILLILSGCNSNTNNNENSNTEDQGSVEVNLIDYTPANSERGSSDASGAIAIDSDYMVVGDDEENVLRVYPRIGGDQVLEFNFNQYLLSEKDAEDGEVEASELDVEALTRYDNNKILIVGSHGNKRNGDDVMDERGHILAVEFTGTGANITFELIGKYSNLEEDLRVWDTEGRHGKGKDYFGLVASSADGVTPESVMGMSIEGAAVSHDSSQLLLGFRAPQMDQTERNQALIVTINNYQELISGNASEAILGLPIELNLAGRGIRDMSPWGEGYLIVAGPASASIAEVAENFALFKWSGDAQDEPVLINNELETLRAASRGSIESIVQPNSSETEMQSVQLLLDNGDTIWEGQNSESKGLDAEDQKFQGAYVQLGDESFDIDAPKLQKITPSMGLQGVNTDTVIELKFDEGITLGEGNILVYQGDTVVKSYKKGDPEVSVTYNSIKVVPTDKLDYNTEYSINITDGFVVDHKNNIFNGATLSEFKSAGRPTPLEPGDIVFVGANAESPDAIAYMLKKDINGGTEIMFSDRDYNNEKEAFWREKDQALATNEGVFRWTADRNMQAGDIVTIQTGTDFSPHANVGQVLGSPSGIGKAETIYAMINTKVEDLSDGYAGVITDPGTFIAAISLGGLDEDNDIPTNIIHLRQYFHPDGADIIPDLADQTNAIFDVDTCGRSLESIIGNIDNTACWKVTFKSEGAVGFPLNDDGSLFAESILSN
ncbi:DUF3616 domain-containing protein [Psychromonas sp. RZ22]|uniref:Ig-like domain-containing protein n=1 Tax=Psychromonas algarum TaxID=2555643 RepID=UPI0010672104|nr:Ig-like domain-containing protein [Psychromonas sp. RZ22]TEW54724.1 DUF3616 domain-containing protein [Psychromonas sp. RZ22]